jgi:hypothetical protein
MRDRHDTIHRVRALMGPGNPVPKDVPAGSWQDQRGLETRLSIMTHAREDGVDAPPPLRGARSGPRQLLPSNARVRRAFAPIAAGLAVTGLVVGLTVALGSPQSQPVAGARAASGAPMPRFYVTLTPQGRFGAIVAEVHASQTGQVLSKVKVGYEGNGVGISADRSDRAYLIDAAASKAGDKADIRLSLLRVSADGRSTTLERLPLVLLPPDSPNVVDGIAVSPDSTKLAVAMQVNQNAAVLNPRGEIIVYSLTGGATQTWTAPGDRALPVDPSWTGGGRLLTFVWQDHLRGSVWFFTGRSQIRRLDTTAPGRNLLASSVLASGGGKLGFIQAAYAGPGKSPAIAALFQVPSIGGTGTAKVRLVELSADGAIAKVFATHRTSYSGQPQEARAVSFCQVLGTDPAGQHSLTVCPGFGRIDNGVFTPLPHNQGAVLAAW